MVDVADLIIMLMHDPLVAIWLVDYLYPERKELEKQKEEAAEQQRREEQWKLTALKMLNQCKPKNDHEAERIAAMKESLS